jgi:hypothetical protein
LNRLKRKQQIIIDDHVMPVLLAMRERQLTTLLFQQSSFKLLLKKLGDANPDLLRKHIRSDDPPLRLSVVLLVGQRHLHLEKELIELFNDPFPPIRKAAHMALVRVARGTDFGPLPGFSQKGIARSIEKWRHWLALQNGESPDAIAKGNAIGGGIAKPGKVDRQQAMQSVLSHSTHMLQTVSPDATRFCDELLKARGEERAKVLERLRDTKGIDNTDALALAIPKLGVGVQRQVREALAQRMTRMKVTTLRDKLEEDNPEVRRAAALACGRKKTTEMIPELLKLLDDPEVMVIQAARRALTELTGEDFGPDEEAGRIGRVRAAAAWRKWWAKKQGEK